METNYKSQKYFPIKVPNKFVFILLSSFIILIFVINFSYAQNSFDPELESLFSDGEKINLKTSKEPAVVILREKVGIVAPQTLVLVKSFDQDSIPLQLSSAFPDKTRRGVTINGKYIAIIRTEYPGEYKDILNHELVHAYISLVSPKSLPFWFQEASAVFFSTNRSSKIYVRTSDNIPGAVEGKVVQLPRNYRQKLQSFQYLSEEYGEKKFFKWYKNAVITGNTDAKPLLGLKNTKQPEPIIHMNFPKLKIIIISVGIVLIIILAAAYFWERSKSDNVE